MINSYDLGPDLAALVGELPSHAVAVRPITGLVAPALGRATFAIRLADGTRLKGRRMDTEADAARVYDLGQRLDASGFARPIVRHGSALLEPWIAGRAVRADEPVQVLQRCGWLLGRVHSLVEDLARDTPNWTIERRLVLTLRRLEALAGDGRISRRRAAKLAALARESQPTSASTGVIHRDLWPRNVVVDPSGAPWIVDNGNIGRGAHGFDLARTDYLWPMTAAQREAFLAGYDATGPKRTHDGVFWAIDVLTDAALFRISSGARGASRPIARLAALVA